MLELINDEVLHMQANTCYELLRNIVECFKTHSRSDELLLNIKSKIQGV
ncbi:MAG: hypothetical protein QXY22_02590 [Candidatus Nitrosotenuis sp.]